MVTRLASWHFPSGNSISTKRGSLPWLTLTFSTKLHILCWSNMNNLAMTCWRKSQDKPTWLGDLFDLLVSSNARKDVRRQDLKATLLRWQRLFVALMKVKLWKPTCTVCTLVLISARGLCSHCAKGPIAHSHINLCLSNRFSQPLLQLKTSSSWIFNTGHVTIAALPNSMFALNVLEHDVTWLILLQVIVASRPFLCLWVVLSQSILIAIKCLGDFTEELTVVKVFHQRHFSSKGGGFPRWKKHQKMLQSQSLDAYKRRLHRLWRRSWYFTTCPGYRYSISVDMKHSVKISW